MKIHTIIKGWCVFLNSKENRNNSKQKREIEDSTKYGEFISSFFSWMTPKEQKERAKRLENIGKED